MKNNNIPAYLNQKQNVIATVVGTAVFAELFILIFRPFGSGNWVSLFGDGDWESMGDLIYAGFATFAILVAMGIIAISRSMMYRYAKKHEITYWQYALWIAGEVLSMSMVYALFSTFVLKVGNGFFDNIESAVLYTACILLIPYAIFLLYFSMKDKSIQLQNIQQMWHEKLASLGKTENSIEEKSIFNFKDEKGELKLSIRTNSLYFIEAADNYVLIHYLNSGKIQKFILRSSLKKIEEEYKKYHLIRCHRSYIVNFDNVKVLRKTDEGLILDFDQEAMPNIPVSKTYSKQLMERMIDNG